MSTNIPARITLRYSDKTGQSPALDKLNAGELAINTADGILYFKNSSGDALYEFKNPTDVETVNQISNIDLDVDGKLVVTLDGGQEFTTATSIVGEDGARGKTGASSQDFKASDILSTGIATDVNVSVYDKFVMVEDDQAGAAVSLYLPSCATCAGFVVTLKKLGNSETVSAVVFAGDLIEDALTFIDIGAQWSTLRLLSDGTKWHIV